MRRSTASITPVAPAGTSTTSIRCATTPRSSTSRRRRPATESSGRAARGRAASAIRSTGAATPRTPIRRWRRRCAAGLSFGLSGFTYWSHDAGGFVGTRAARSVSPLAGVRRAHVAHAHARRAAARAVGVRRRRWSTDFRRAVELKYALMPYIYAQAQDVVGARVADAAHAVLRASRTTRRRG